MMKTRQRSRGCHGYAVALLASMLAWGGNQPIQADETTSEGVSIDEVLSLAYSGVRDEQVPTGILLERGAIFGGDFVLRHDGALDSGGNEDSGGFGPDGEDKGEAGHEGEPEAATGLTPDDFKTAYLDLQRGSFHVHLPELEAINRRARAWREEAHATPISLAIVDYDTIRNDPEPSAIDGVLQWPPGRLGETRRFVGAFAAVDAVYGWQPRFVIPSNLLVLNGLDVDAIGAIEARIGDAPAQAVELDQPFEPAWLPTVSGTLSYSVTVQVGVKHLKTEGTIPIFVPTHPKNPPPKPPTTLPTGPRSTLDCTQGTWVTEGPTGSTFVPFYDIDRTVVGDAFNAPWEEAGQTSTQGRLNVRVIPANNGVATEPGSDTCEVALGRPVVIVDGFDVLNMRTQDSILQDFGGVIKTLLDLGFDIVMVDYQNGRDWIERNGRAFRKLMTDDIRDLVDPVALQRNGVAVVAGSMGTQVARWGLMEAENSGEEHHTELFINIDGPFFGANIPIGFQRAAVDLGNRFAAATAFRASLESPAASQLLVRTFPRGGTFFGSGWYLPRPEFTSFFAAAAALGGLPGQSRNVAGADGSGTGSLQTDLGPDVRLLRAESSGGAFGWSLRFHAEVRTDGPGAKVYERYQCFRILGWPVQCGSVGAVQANGLGLDVAAGGFRQTTNDFIAGVGNTVEFLGRTFGINYSSDLDRHAFVPTASAFGAESWDNRTWEKCNAQHGTSTPTLRSLIISELIAWRDGVTPSEAPLFRTACNQPEPVENCFAGVVWWEDPNDPEYIQPWDDGANCYVTPQPAGFDAEIAANSYAVQPDSLVCFDGSQPVGSGCLVTEVTAPEAIAVAMPIPGLLHIEVLNLGGGGGGASDCPANTNFLGVSGDPFDVTVMVECAVEPPPGVPTTALFLDSFTVMAPPEQLCGIGIPRFLGNQFLCYLGIAPNGTDAFKFGSGFYYEGWD